MTCHLFSIFIVQPKKDSVDVRSIGAVRTSEMALISLAVIAKLGICLTNLSNVLLKF